MILKRCITAPALAALLVAGCANPNVLPADDPCALPMPDNGGISINGPLTLVMIPIALLYGLGCEGVRALDRHGAFTPAPKGEVEDGIYRPVDGSFSVAVPAGLDIREQLSPQRDYVFFVPRLTRGPVYGVTVDRDLDPEYAALSVDEYAALALKDARFQKLQASDAPLVERHREDVSLDGQPALSVIYSQTPRGAGGPATWHLMYFIKARKNAAVLFVIWPKDCPKCAGGPEQDVRGMDPEIEKFVDSFHLADTVKGF